MNTVPKPVSVTKDTVTLSRADWEVLVERFDNATDRTALLRSKMRSKEGRDDALPVAFYRRIRGGEHPLRVWREYRDIGLNTLARKAGMSSSYLSEIETGSKPGSAVTLKKLAEALSIDMDELVRE
jgi:DNA-binding Xre family transcriptional regulator